MKFSITWDDTSPHHVTLIRLAEILDLPVILPDVQDPNTAHVDHQESGS